MKEDMLLQIFTEQTSGKNYEGGQRVLNNDLVSSIDITDKDDFIYIDGNVISENLFNEYRTRIKIHAGDAGVEATYCSCEDYEKRSPKKKNYACKHIVATFYKASEELSSHPLLKSEEESQQREGKSILSMLLGEDRKKEELRIEVYINKREWNEGISAELRIGPKALGSNSLYVIRDINQFLLACQSSIPLEYSKNFTLNLKHQRLSTDDRRLLDFIESLSEMEGKFKHINKSAERYLDGKYINIPSHLVRSFLEIVERHRAYLGDGFFGRPVRTEILHTEPPIDFDLRESREGFVLKSPGGMPMSLSRGDDVLLYGDTIYLPSYDFCYRLEPYLELFSQAKTITIPSSEEDGVLRRLIPSLHVLSQRVKLSKSIEERIVRSEVGFSFYFDKAGKEIALLVKVKYGSYEFNIFGDIEEKVIYRDSQREQEVLSVLAALGFEEIEGIFYLLRPDDYIFDFFKNDISKLQALGEVFYSENFKGIKSVGKKDIVGEIRPGKYDYFEMNFKLSDIPPEETADILRAFRDNLKYYKLKNGEYLDLYEMEVRGFLKLLDMVAPEDFEENHIRIPKGKAGALEEYMEDNDLRYIKGMEELREVSIKLKNLETHKLPEGLRANLREYQRTGYNWFQTLDYLGFGGILGDEMGLGKTLQTISFLMSKPGSRSLIVAPTSLVYNWVSEFQRFAPGVSVVPLNGPREEREEVISSLEKYDVLITTYNLLRRDLPLYKDVEFDYCILDEAQNIKNPGSLNALSVKQIRAGRRFALTGTPIENSLMELWSIFDFVMPGYLFDERRFSVRYHKRLNEGPEVLEELNRLIKPFILRRRKADVIKELPDKIEKKLVVELDDEQKRVYGTYAKHVVEVIEKRVRDDEFKRSKVEILSYITKLRQLCLDPSVVMNDYRGGSGKIEALMELLQKSLDEGHRALVFSQFTSVLKNIGKRLEEEGISFSYLDGSIPSERRMELVKSFNEGENSVFLISLKAGGTGLNLTSADLVIHFDPWWNPAVEDQATDRAHRIGQRNVVEVIRLIARGTIEEKVLALQEEKRKLISELMRDELSAGDGLGALTEEELLELFRRY